MGARACRYCRKDISHLRATALHCHFVCKERYHKQGPQPLRITN